MRFLPKSRVGRTFLGLFTALVASVAVCAILLFLRWPFTKAKIVRELEEVSASKVDVQSFRATYFPRPGCVAGGLVFHHKQDIGQPFIAIASLRIESGMAGLFSEHIARVTAQGMHVTIAHGMQETFPEAKASKIVIQDLIADDSLLEFSPADPTRQPLTFLVHQFHLQNVGTQNQTSFNVAVSNPLPPGKITAHGRLGPWNQRREQTPVSGEYEFSNADLGAFHGIAGKLSSGGKFSGVLGRIEVSGDTDVTDFEVASSTNRTELRTEFSALVNMRNGDVDLHRVLAHFRQTVLLAVGRIAAQPEKGRTAEISLFCKNGRVQDLLRLFTKSGRVPMSGVLSFSAQASIPNGKQTFLKKVQLTGNFGVVAGEFDKPETQHSVDHLSAGARGEKNPEDSDVVLSDLKGHADLRQGVATLSQLTFSVPGAVADMHGTYNVITERVDLHGDLTTRKSIANTSSGLKSVALRVLSPFFKKNHSEQAPVKITGSYSHPSFGLDLAGKKNGH